MKSLAQVEPRTPIHELPAVIDAPGSYYLAQNLGPVPPETDGIFIEANIQVTSISCAVENNLLNGGYYGLEVIGTGNYLAGNRATHNHTAYSIVAGNTTGTGDLANVSFWRKRFLPPPDRASAVIGILQPRDRYRAAVFEPGSVRFVFIQHSSGFDKIKAGDGSVPRLRMRATPGIRCSVWRPTASFTVAPGNARGLGFDNGRRLKACFTSAPFSGNSGRGHERIEARLQRANRWGSAFSASVSVPNSFSGTRKARFHFIKLDWKRYHG